MNIRTIEKLSYKELLVEGVNLRNANEVDYAEIILLAARTKDKSEWQADYELSILYNMRGDFEYALGFAISSFKKTGGLNVNALSLCFKIATKIQNDNIVKEISKISNITSIDIAKRLHLLYQAYRFKCENNADKREVVHQNLIDKSKGNANKSQVINMIKGAYEKSLPFCFIRLGDGEGTWLFKDSEYELKYHNLSHANKLEFLKIWYGNLSPNDIFEFELTTQKISLSIAESDLIGVPPNPWIDHEFDTASIRGMPGTLNVIKMLNQGTSFNYHLCSQLTHFELSESEDFYEFISSLKSLSVITCHPGIVNYFKGLGINNVRFIPVPGEPSRTHLHGKDAISGCHFPEGYNRIMQDIKNGNWSGEVCLIGAGILGKQYALEIKKHGGIAIDVGSLMDKWMGKKTRPQFGK